MTGVLSALVLGWAFAVASVSLWAAIRSSPSKTTRTPSVKTAVLVRPCAGAEPQLERVLRSTALAARSFPMRARFALASEDDGAWPAAQSACEHLRRAGLDVRVIATSAIGPNRKADQLARVLSSESERVDVVIVADSDVDLEAVSFDDLVSPLARPGVAAAWAAPVEVEPRTIADRASAAVLDASLHAFPLLAALDPHGLVGKLVAIRVDALEAVGGFSALVEHLGEDMELARRLGASGWSCELTPVRARSLAQGRSWGEVVERYARWISVIRAQRPGLLLAYPLLLAATPGLVVLSLAAWWADGPPALLAGSLALASRLGVAWLARVRCARPVRLATLPLDALLADGLLLAAFMRATASRRMSWRGIALHLDDTGRLRNEAEL